jgi:hypothetical protein
MQAKLEVDSGLPEWQSNLINNLFNTIINNYVFPEKIDEAAFKKILTADFAKINLEFPSADKENFCSEVNNILKKIDPHLILQYDPGQIADHKAHGRVATDSRENGCAKFNMDGVDSPASWYEKFGRENYGFQLETEGSTSSVPEATGYVKINDFLDPRDGLGRLAQEAAHKILKSMQGKEAVIIDLRDSHGGSPEMVGKPPGVQPKIDIEDGQDALEVALSTDSMRSRATLIPAETFDPGKTLEFKDRLREIAPIAPTSTASIGDADKAKDKSSITPLQTTPKPPRTA